MAKPKLWRAGKRSKGAGSIGGKVGGARAFMRRLEKLGPDVVAATDRGLYAWAQRILANAAGRAPMDTGNLRASGRVVEGDFKTILRHDVVFGGGNVPYATVQHDRTDFHHEEGEALYLEKAFRDEVKGTGKRQLEDLVRQALDRRK